MFSPILGTFRPPEHFFIFFYFLSFFCYLPNCKQSTFNFKVPGQLCAGGGYVGGLRHRQGEPTSSANYESSPSQILSCPHSRPCSLSVCWGTRLAADPMSSRALCCACPCQPGGRHGPGGTHADGGAVSQQSVTGATPSAQLVSLLAPDTAAFLTVFSLLVQHCQQEAASTKLVSPKFRLCCCLCPS